ncbi:TPA: hypothetical protein ACH3X1_008497 [Trebouxia sp. C0004]
MGTAWLQHCLQQAGGTSRAVKPLRTVEDIMQNVQDLADDGDRVANDKAKAEADAMAMNASTHQPMQPQSMDHPMDDRQHS